LKKITDCYYCDIYYAFIHLILCMLYQGSLLIESPGCISQFDGVTLKYVELLDHKTIHVIIFLCSDICTVYVKLCILLYILCTPDL